MLQKIFHDFVTLFVVVNPIGVVPLFIAIAGHQDAARRRQIVTHAIIVSAVILLAFIAIGQVLLEALGIDLSSFQIAGGLVLLIIALRMVLEETRVVRLAEPDGWSNVAVFPLAMPFIAGPASLMAVVLLTDENVYTVWEQVETSIVMLAVLGITYGCLIGATTVQRLLGNTGVNVVSRIMGLLLAALAVKSIMVGVHELRFG